MLLGVLLFAYSLGVVAQQREWVAKDFPNPSVQPERCGFTKVSPLCDPDRVITTPDQELPPQPLLDVIGALEREPVLTCNQKNGTSTTIGLKVGILVVKAIDTSDCDKRSSLWQSHCLERFARTVGEQWELGDKQCHNGVLIALCTGLKTVYIVTAGGARKVISDEWSREVSEVVMKPFFAKKEYTEGLIKGVEALHDILLNTKPDRVYSFLIFMFFGIAILFILGHHLPILLISLARLVLFLSLPVVILADKIRWWWNKRSRREVLHDFNRVSGVIVARHDATSSLRDTVASAALRQVLCPICLEETSDVPVKRLDCSHEFHKICIDQWFTNQGDERTCPICRGVSDDTNEPSDDTQRRSRYRNYVRFVMEQLERRHAEAARALGGASGLERRFYRQTGYPDNPSSCASRPTWFSTFADPFDQPLTFRCLALTRNDAPWYQRVITYSNDRAISSHTQIYQASSRDDYGFGRSSDWHDSGGGGGGGAQW